MYCADIDLLCTVHSIFIDASNIFDKFFLMHGIIFTISLFRKAMGFPLEMLANWQVGKFINLFLSFSDKKVLNF